MTEHSEDLAITQLLAPLGRLETVPFARREPASARWFRHPALVAAVVVVALVLAGVAIADGFGAFNGISAAQGPQTPAALKWAKQFQSTCPSRPSGSSFYFPQCHLVLASARLLSPGSQVYVVTDTRGDLCESVSFGQSCGQPLNASRPITMTITNTGPIPPGGDLTVGGVALNGVTSVSFTIWGKPVTVPVENNVYVYRRRDSTAHDAHCVVVHMADGSRLDYPPTPCP